MNQSHADGDGLRERGREYVKSYLLSRRGLREGIEGLWEKTLPAALRLHRISFPRVLALGVRFALLATAAVFPMVVRKSIGQSDQNLAGLLLHWSSLDVFLALVALSLVFAPKLLDLLDKPEPSSSPSSMDELAASIAKMPPVDCSGRGRDGDAEQAINDAIESALRGLRDEMQGLVGDVPDQASTEVDLLQFADEKGIEMFVRGRTVPIDDRYRRVKSFKLLAYHAAVTAKPMMENDFLNTRNPYPKERVTVPIGRPVDYRSVMYLPITSSERIGAPSMGNSGLEVKDWAIGVVCVRSKGPFRFWRWGDHKRVGGAFGTVAYARSAPYIALIARLLERTAVKVEVEAP